MTIRCCCCGYVPCCLREERRMHAELDTKWTSHSGRKFSMWPPNYPMKHIRAHRYLHKNKHHMPWITTGIGRASSKRREEILVRVPVPNKRDSLYMSQEIGVHLGAHANRRNGYTCTRMEGYLGRGGTRLYPCHFAPIAKMICELQPTPQILHKDCDHEKWGRKAYATNSHKVLGTVKPLKMNMLWW